MINDTQFDRLLSVLSQNQQTEVRFKKKSDESERIITGTRNLSFIPQEHHPKKVALHNSTRDRTPNQPLTIFEHATQQWRSFIPNNVIDASAIEFGRITEKII